MLNKLWPSAADAVADIASGSTLLVSGFGGSGVPEGLLAAVAATGIDGLTVISNNAGYGDVGVAALIRNGQVARMVCSFPRGKPSSWFEQRYLAGAIELELVPQGTLSERIRAGGSGIAAFYTPAGAGTLFAEGKETRVFDGREWVLERAITADFSLVRGHVADRWGNITYRKAARNYGPIMAAAGGVTIVEVDETVELGAIDPETVVTPGIYVDRVVRTAAVPAIAGEVTR